MLECFDEKPKEEDMKMEGDSEVISKIFEAFRIESKYDSLKATISASIDSFMDYKIADINVQKICKKRNDIQIELTYCDYTYILDFSEVFIENGTLWSKVIIFEKIKDFKIDSVKTEYRQIGDAIYFDGHYCYESTKDKHSYKSFNLGVLNLIAAALGKRFDPLP